MAQERRYVKTFLGLLDHVDGEKGRGTDFWGSNSKGTRPIFTLIETLTEPNREGPISLKKKHSLSSSNASRMPGPNFGRITYSADIKYVKFL